MKRKTPYEHDVGTHQRHTPSGELITVDKYKRGHGKAPQKRKNSLALKSQPESVYNITYIGGDGYAETYNVEGSPAMALKDGLGRLQRAFLPEKAIMRRIA